MTIKGYSIVNLKNEDGSYTHGFRKIKSALDNWEKLRDEQEKLYEEALQAALNDTKELNWIDRNLRGMKSKVDKLKQKSVMPILMDFKDTNLDRALWVLGYLSFEEYIYTDRDLRFIADLSEYNKLCAIIKNGEQFMLDDKLCSFVNSYSTHKPQGGK